MFAVRKDLLFRASGPTGVGRLEYLQSLVREFSTEQCSKDPEARLQIVAHLANFAYDPINFEYLRALNVVDLFIDCLIDEPDALVAAAVSGLANLAADPANAKAILAADGLGPLMALLTHKVPGIVVSATTALYFVCTPQTQKDLASDKLQHLVRANTASSHPTVRNVSQTLLDLLTAAQDGAATEAQSVD